MTVGNFVECIRLDSINEHILRINHIGNWFALPIERHDRKLHDLRCIITGAAFECKSDYKSSSNAAIEIATNITGHDMQTRYEAGTIDHSRLLKMFDTLPNDKRSLMNPDETESNHWFSYLKTASTRHLLMPLSLLQSFMRENVERYDICARNSERNGRQWHCYSAIVPMNDLFIATARASASP